MTTRTALRLAGVHVDEKGLMVDVAYVPLTVALAVLLGLAVKDS